MMKKRLEALLFAMILLLTAMGGAAAEDKEPCLVLNAVARYPRESYPLDLMGMTEEIPYLLTVTNTGGAACALSHLRFQTGDVWHASSFLNTVLEAGQSVTFLHSQRFFRDDLVPGTESEGTLGTVEIVFTVHGGENGEYVSNEARFSHRISAAKADFPTVGAELVQTELKVIGASVHPAGYQAGEKVYYQATVTNLSSQTLPSLHLQAIGGAGETEALDLGQLSDFHPGEERVVSFADTIDEKDLTNGCLYRAVSAAWTDPVSQESRVSRSVPAVVMTLRSLSSPQPAGDGIRLTASLNSAPGNGICFVPGETALVSLRAVNDSSSALNQITLLGLTADALGEPLMEIPSLLPGEEAAADLKYTVTELDALLGRICIFAAARASDVYGSLEMDVCEPLTAPAGLEESAGLTPEANGVSALNTDRGLTLIHRETCAPAQGGAYKAGDTITYETIVFHGECEGVWDVTIRTSPEDIENRAEQMGPGDFARFTFEHTVTEAEEKAGCIVSWAYAEAEQDGVSLGLTRAEAPAVSPAGSGQAVSQGSFALPLEGEGCSLTLLAKGLNAAEYSQHYCARHAALYKTVHDLTAQADTEEALLDAWEQAAALWTAELEALYREYLAAASGTARMAVIQEKAACLASLDSQRALMDQLYPDAPAEAARAVAEEAMRQCLELCGEGHSAPGARGDSLFRNGLDKIVSAGAEDACGRMTMLNQDETVRYRDTLCAVHSTVEEAAAALLEKAADGQNARALWFAAFQAILNKQYEKGGEVVRSAAAVYALRMDLSLAARAETLALMYPDDPQAAQEAAARNAMRAVLALCREGVE